MNAPKNALFIIVPRFYFSLFQRMSRYTQQQQQQRQQQQRQQQQHHRAWFLTGVPRHTIVPSNFYRCAAEC
jgi:hypothetical protein